MNITSHKIPTIPEKTSLSSALANNSSSISPTRNSLITYSSKISEIRNMNKKAKDIHNIIMAFLARVVLSLNIFVGFYKKRRNWKLILKKVTPFLVEY